MEDYKEKYEQALERANAKIETYNHLGNASAVKSICEIFPELKESEDERIRKEIIEFVKSRGGFKQEYITWLEKRVEQKPTDKVEPKFKVKYAGSEYNVLEVKDIAGVVFYGIEDEPNHIDYVKAENCKIISGYAIKENGLPYPTKHAVFSEQKSAWSEEDEHCIELLLPIIDSSSLIPKNRKKCKKFLKSLKERVKPQPNQEWSEEDEIRAAQIISDLEKCTVPGFPVYIGGVELEINWLKSLKERYTWKPSNEQIEALLKLEEMHVLEHEKNQENAHLYMVIKSLKEQLFKLKGE